MFANIRLGWKVLPRTSTYLITKIRKITAVKSFISLGTEERLALNIIYPLVMKRHYANNDGKNFLRIFFVNTYPGTF